MIRVMDLERITSAANPRIKRLTALQQKAEDAVMQSQADGKERVQK